MELKEAAELARNEWGVAVDPDYKGEEALWVGFDVPFNLERLYLDELIQNNEYESASKLLSRMRHSYTSASQQNFIESYEYHLKSIKQSEAIIELSLNEAKKDFNQHTITLISVIVGIITLFGTASKTLEAKNFEESLYSFIAISGAVIFLIFMISEINKRGN